MFASTLSLALALVPFVSAAIIDIQVGANGLQYTPEAIGANVGDQVVFHFHAKNHTVTQSSFADPCGKLDGGINSGFMPVAANQTDNLPTFTVQVKDTKPIWIYCAQAARTPASHCGAGMVFAINCGADGAPNSFTNFKKSALAVGASLSASAAAATPTASGSSGGAYGGGYGGAAPAATDSASAAWTTAAYGGVTIPAAPQATPVTQAVTLGTETWTTTYGSYPGSPDPTPASSTGNVIKVVVGGPGQLAFNPPRVDAKPRDTIVFEFHEKNHTVTQSSFDDPCRKLNANGVTGFDSGFMPFSGDASTPFPTFNFTVTDTAPVWAYCRQQNPSSHCGAGMVFAINSDESSGRNFAAFQNVAKSLNGTAVAANAPLPTTTAPASAASAVKVGSLSLTLFAAALVGSLVL